MNYIVSGGWVQLGKVLMAIGLVLIGYHVLSMAAAFIGSIIVGIIGAIPVAAVAIGLVLLGIVTWAVKKITSFGKDGPTKPNMPSTGYVDSFAKGGVSAGGLAIVGELGPELVNLPKGSKVHSNAQSRKMAGNTINVHVNGRVGASDQEIRDIARKVGVLINREINRTTSSATRS